MYAAKENFLWHFYIHHLTLRVYITKKSTTLFHSALKDNVEAQRVYYNCRYYGKEARARLRIQQKINFGNNKKIFFL